LNVSFGNKERESNGYNDVDGPLELEETMGSLEVEV